MSTVDVNDKRICRCGRRNDVKVNGCEVGTIGAAAICDDHEVFNFAGRSDATGNRYDGLIGAIGQNGIGDNKFEVRCGCRSVEWAEGDRILAVREGAVVDAIAGNGELVGSARVLKVQFYEISTIGHWAGGDNVCLQVKNLTVLPKKRSC